jgi:hypothetical protein
VWIGHAGTAWPKKVYEREGVGTDPFSFERNGTKMFDKIMSPGGGVGTDLLSQTEPKFKQVNERGGGRVLQRKAGSFFW